MYPDHIGHIHWILLWAPLDQHYIFCIRDNEYCRKRCNTLCDMRPDHWCKKTPRWGNSHTDISAETHGNCNPARRFCNGFGWLIRCIHPVGNSDGQPPRDRKRWRGTLCNHCHPTAPLQCCIDPVGMVCTNRTRLYGIQSFATQWQCGTFLRCRPHIRGRLLGCRRHRDIRTPPGIPTHTLDCISQVGR